MRWIKLLGGSVTLATAACVGCCHDEPKEAAEAREATRSVPAEHGGRAQDSPKGAVAPTAPVSDAFVSRHCDDEALAVVKVRVSRVESVSIRRGLLGLVKSEYISATVVQVIHQGAGFGNDVPRRMLKVGLEIDIVNKPGSDADAGWLGLEQAAPGKDQSGVPLGFLAAKAEYLLAVRRPGRKGFLLVDAMQSPAR